MAKIISGIGEDIKYSPGVIYDLGAIDNGTRIPFYVGETSNAEQRLAEHQRSGRAADQHSTVVYQTIKELDNAGIEWTMEILAEYGSEGPTDLEDEWIMNHLVAGIKLANMKKGNANWMTERQTAAADMRTRNITSYRQYRKVITQEDLDKKHAEWLREQAAANEYEQTRKKIMADIAAAQLETIARKKKEDELKEQRRLAAEARWAADAPAREARLKKQAEILEEREKNDQRRREIELMEIRALNEKNKINKQSRKAAAWEKEYHANLLKTGLFEEVKK
jgi:hypothetical protein